ncbi:hypothetical protein AMATHDRAFT_139898 [Amanita thiersii Skay4041]|uniref:Non-ribosomal peptide synthetase n=1 Tax=Amanita thiersii Skay4041 TaxID=703135 RepID=A0A2A9NX99_9AGAR|nr:hypothetical protein AMATHDRAFT_139898 [Amanita thiersii Skay4041]
MSSEVKAELLAPIDPERGNLEPLPLRISTDQRDQKVAVVGTPTPTLSEKKEPEKKDGENKESNPPKEKEVAKPPAKPPAKPKRKVSKWILFQLWFNTYRKFFVIAFGLNMIGLGFAAGGIWEYANIYSGPIVVANFNFAILMRNEVFGRLLYLIVNTCFAKWPPLSFRLGCTSVLQHLGGIHSGCALSGLVWLLYKVIMNFIDTRIQHPAVLVMGMITLTIVGLSALSAFPWIRNNHHNVFERHHRFLGWTGLFSTWSFVILFDMWDKENRRWNTSGVHLVRQQDFWFTLGMTVFVALPWFFVREVPIDIELPSSKVAVIRFKRGMQQGLLGRISRSPIWEYHAFGIISEGKHAKYHYMIAGVQGDFTRSLVQDPPKTIWTRELKFAGVSNTSAIYKRGVRVCTGTGIGAGLSTCIQSPNWFLIWIGSDQERTFGPTISGLIHKHVEPERLLLWDSKQRGGRPDLMKIIKEAYYSFGAEVVFITSNYVGNSEMLQGCKEAGIPAFGTLWDFVRI